jgi:hypothetical protein
MARGMMVRTGIAVLILPGALAYRRPDKDHRGCGFGEKISAFGEAF